MQEPDNFIRILARSFGGEYLFKFVPKAGTSVFFDLRHAIHLSREMRNEIKQTLRSERVAF